MQRLQKLNTQHKAAARLKVEGYSIDAMVVELGVAKRTLHVWFSDDLMKDEVKRLMDRVEDVFVEKKAEAGLRALSELSRLGTQEAGILLAVCRTCGWFGHEARNHGDPQNLCTGPWAREVVGVSEETKLKSLESILDRVDEVTTLRDRARAQEALTGGGEGGGVNSFVQIFQQSSDADLARVMRRWAGGEGPPDIETNGRPALNGSG